MIRFARDDVRHPTSFESRVDACRTPRYIYIYKILCLILWLQRCGARVCRFNLPFRMYIRRYHGRYVSDPNRIVTVYRDP